MPQVAIALLKIGFFVFEAVAGAAAAASLGAGAAVAIGAAVVVGGVLVAKQAMALFEIEMPAVDTDASRQRTVKGTTEPQKIIYGEALVSGPISFIGLSGTNNSDLYQTIVLAGHELTDITDIHMDDVVITDSQINGGSDAGGNVTAGIFGPKNSSTICVIKKHLGEASQTADSLLTGTFANYTSAHRGDGIAYLTMKWVLNEDSAETWEKYAPQNVKALVQGKSIYDPRLEFTAVGTRGQDTTNANYIAYSTNPSLCVADYLMDTYLGMSIPASKIDWDAVTTAADGCDATVNVPGGTESRFTCNGVIFATDSHQKNINKILSAMNGNLVYSNGKYIVHAGIYEAPTETLTEDDLTGAISIKTSLERSDRFNTIKGLFIDPAQNHKSSEFPKVQLADAVTRDNNEILEKEVQFPMTNSSYMAQRLAHKLIQLSDQQKIVTFPANLSALRITAGDRVQVSIEELNWSNKVFQCAGWTFSEDGGVNLTLREDSSTSYDDPTVTPTNEYSTVTATGSITDAFRGVPSPSGLTVTPGLKSNELNWVNPGKPDDFGTIYVYASRNANFSSAVKIGETDGTQFVHDASNKSLLFSAGVFNIGDTYTIRDVGTTDFTTIGASANTAGVVFTATGAGSGTGKAWETVVPGNTRYYWVRAVKNVGTDAASRSNLEPNADPNTTVFATVGDVEVDWDNVADPTIGIDLNNDDSISINLGASNSTSGQAVAQSGISEDVTITQGGIRMNQGGSIRGGQTSYNSGEGFFLGYDSNKYKLSIRNSTSEALTFDGDDLTVTGTVNASSGAFTGDVSTDSKFIAGSGDATTVVDGATDATYRIFSGAAESESENAPFQVKPDGSVFAKNITVFDASGNILLNQDGLGAAALAGISLTSGTAVDKVSGVLSGDGGEMTLTLDQTATVTLETKFAIYDNSVGTLYLRGTGATSSAALSDITNATLNIVYSLQTDGGSYSTAATKPITFTSTDSTPSSTEVYVTAVQVGGSYLTILMDAGGALEYIANTSTYGATAYVVTSHTFTNLPAGVHKVKLSSTITGSGSPAAAGQSTSNRLYELRSSAVNFVESAANVFANGTPSVPTGGGTVSGNLVVTGNLTVNGTTTTVDTDNLTVKDNNITLNYATGDSSSTANNAGITIQDAVDASTDASILWKTASDTFDFSHKLKVPNVEIDGQTLTSSNDLDSLSDGFYKWSSSQPTNAPAQYMVMYQMADPNQKIQIAWGASTNGKLYVRRADNGTFYAWTQMLTTASASSTYLPLAGGTLTGALGGTTISASGSSGSTAIISANGDADGQWAGRFENTHTSGYGILGITASNSVNQSAFEIRKNTSDQAMLIKADGTFFANYAAVFADQVQIGDTVQQNSYGLLQVNQEANNDESGIGILDSTGGRSMRLWTDNTKSYINSGDGGSGDLIFNEAITVSSGGNLTGVGTISSGRHTITSTGTIGGATVANGYSIITDGTSTLALDPNEIHTTSTLYILSEQADIYFRGLSNAGVILRNGTTQFMDASRNLTNIGAITSAGDASITGGSSGSTVLTLTTNSLVDTPLMVFQRTGSAVAGKLAYEDSNTAMSFGTTTAHELKFLTNNTSRLEINSTGNAIFAGSITSSDVIKTTQNIQSGDGSGGVALTINDGYGNANVTWNHENGTPEQNGNAARIEVNTDSTSGASMRFELLSNVSSGTATALTSVFELQEDKAELESGVAFYMNGNSVIDSSRRADFAEVDVSGRILINGGAGGSALLDVDDAVSGDWAGRFENSDASGYGLLAITASNSASQSAFEVRKNTSNQAMLIKADGTFFVQYTATFNDTLLVGKTTTSLLTAGIALNSNGAIYATVDNERPLILNRETADGSIAEFRKDNSIAGVVASVSGDIVVGTGNTGLRFYNAGRAIQPRDTDGTAANDVIDLGMSTNRFRDLHLSNRAFNGDGSASAPSISFGADTNTGFYRVGSDKIGFVTAGTIRAMLDNSGNFLVGKTSLAIANEGIVFEKGGAAEFTTDAARVMRLNRTSDDGSILELNKDGTTVGSLGSKSDDLYISTGDTGIRFNDGNDQIWPVGTNGASRDAAISLGNSGVRFASLYLSGTAHIPEVNVGRGVVYLESNSNGSNDSGAGVTLRTSSNPSGNGSIFDVRSSGQATRFYVGQDLTSSGYNPFYVGNSNSTTNNGVASNYSIELLTNGSITAEGNITAYGSASDIRLKENIETIPNALEKIKSLTGVTFNYKKDGSRSTGVIAQEVQKVLPEVIYETSEVGRSEEQDSSFLAVRYGQMMGLAIEAIKDLSNEIDELKNEIKELKNGD
jgi:hypothetical protein